MATTEARTTLTSDATANGTNGIGNGDETAATAPATTTGASAPAEPAEAVWDALRVNLGASVADIATAAGVAPHVARRVLRELETAGRAARTPGGRKDGRRAPDAWLATPTGDETTDLTTSDTVPEAATAHAPGGIAEVPASAEAEVEVEVEVEPTGSALGSGDEATPPAITRPAGDEPDETPTVPVPGPNSDGSDGMDGADGAVSATADGLDAVAVAEAQEVLTVVMTAASSAWEALKAGDRTAALNAAETIYGVSGKARRMVRTAANGNTRTGSGAVKSPPGQLRAKVAAHLSAHPGKEFTPHEIANVLGHSAGAIANALDRLTALGEAMETCERPRRFATTAPTATATAAAGSA